MDALTVDNYLLVLEGLGQVALNFWPVVLFAALMLVYEGRILEYRLARVRLKTENANRDSDGNNPYRDRTQV